MRFILLGNTHKQTYQQTNKQTNKEEDQLSGKDLWYILCTKENMSIFAPLIATPMGFLVIGHYYFAPATIAPAMISPIIKS